MTNRITEGRLFLHQRSGLKGNNYDTVTGKIERETGMLIMRVVQDVQEKTNFFNTTSNLSLWSLKLCMTKINRVWFSAFSNLILPMIKCTGARFFAHSKSNHIFLNLCAFVYNVALSRNVTWFDESKSSEISASSDFFCSERSRTTINDYKVGI